MTSDLPGDLRADGLRPEDFGPAAPGLQQLLLTLGSGPAADELASEQAALQMFRANVRPPAAAPAASTRPLRLRRPAIRRMRLAVATAAVLVGGLAAAAYTSVLPAPIQHAAYQAFHFIGVPDVQHGHSTGHHRGAHSSRPGGQPGAGRSHRAPSSGTGSSAPGTAAPRPSASSSPSAAAGSAVLSAQAASSQIPAGTAATVSGQLTSAGKPLGGQTVRLMEHVADRLGWHLAGQATTNAQGDVSITVPSLVTTARFRLTGPHGATSAIVRITVVPSVAVSITAGPKGINYYLTCAAVYAQRGDVVLLQVQDNGAWVKLQIGFLNRSGNKVFVLSAKRTQGKVLRCVLLGTELHARAVSAQITVP